jgi:hypothetical protein
MIVRRGKTRRVLIYRVAERDGTCSAAPPLWKCAMRLIAEAKRGLCQNDVAGGDESERHTTVHSALWDKSRPTHALRRQDVLI